MAFTDEMIRAVVKTGQYSDPSAEKLLGDVLIKRRDKVGHAYFTRVNPLVNFWLDTSGVLNLKMLLRPPALLKGRAPGQQPGQPSITTAER